MWPPPQEGDVGWVPYGHHVWMIGMKAENQLLYAPMVYDKLLQTLQKPLLRKLADWNAALYTECPDASAKEMGAGCRRWMSRAS